MLAGTVAPFTPPTVGTSSIWDPNRHPSPGGSRSHPSTALLPGSAGKSPGSTHVKLADVLLQLDLAPGEVLPGTAPQRRRDPLLAPQPDLRGETQPSRGKSRSSREQRGPWGKMEARPSTAVPGWSPAASLYKGMCPCTPGDRVPRPMTAPGVAQTYGTARGPETLLTPFSPALHLTCQLGRQPELHQHEGAADGCQEPGRGFVACKQLQTSPALPQSRILLGAGKSNSGAKVRSGWLPPHPGTAHGKHWGHRGGLSGPQSSPPAHPWGREEQGRAPCRASQPFCPLTPGRRAGPVPAPHVASSRGRLRAHSQPPVSLAQGTSQDQSPCEAVPVPTPRQGAEPA